MDIETLICAVKHDPLFWDTAGAALMLLSSLNGLERETEAGA
jgi:hypothetical protein